MTDTTWWHYNILAETEGHSIEDPLRLTLFKEEQYKGVWDMERQDKISRRTFLKATAAAAAGITVLPSLFSAASGASDSLKPSVPGGSLVLHWQPNDDYSLIQYNTVEDQALHVLDTKTLELQSYRGAGTHSNMAFFNGDGWLVATDHLQNGTKLHVIDRNTNRVLSETEVGDWGHGVTVIDMENDTLERIKTDSEQPGTL